MAEQISPLKQKLTDDLKQAMKGGNKLKTAVIRLIMAAIQNTEIARRTPPADADVLGIIAREVRQRQESIESFKPGDRPDLVAKEEAEMTILQAYLPRQLTREEIMAEVRRIIDEVGARGPGDKGKVMSRIITQLKGKADGREINAVVTELLSS